jgi:hypothetical protein
METKQLKVNFHQLIDSIDNEQILAKFYCLMDKTNNASPGQLWSRLNKEEQEELLQADIESDDPQNLISHSVVQKKHEKWL